MHIVQIRVNKWLLTHVTQIRLGTCVMYLHVFSETHPSLKQFSTKSAHIWSAFMFPDMVDVITFITESLLAKSAAEFIVPGVLFRMSEENKFTPKWCTTKVANKSVLGRVEVCFFFNLCQICFLIFLGFLRFLGLGLSICRGLKCIENYCKYWSVITWNVANLSTKHEKELFYRYSRVKHFNQILYFLDLTKICILVIKQNNLHFIWLENQTII